MNQQQTNVPKNGTKEKEKEEWSVFALITNPTLMKKFKKGTNEYNIYNRDSANYYIVYNGSEIACLNYMSTIRNRIHN